MVQVENNFSDSLQDSQVSKSPMPISSVVPPVDLLPSSYSNKYNNIHPNSTSISTSSHCETTLVPSMTERIPCNDSLDDGNGSLSPPTSPTASSSPPPPMPVEPPSTALAPVATVTQTVAHVVDPTSPSTPNGANGISIDSNVLISSRGQSFMGNGSVGPSKFTTSPTNLSDTMDERAPSSPVISKQDEKEQSGQLSVSKPSLSVEVMETSLEDLQPSNDDSSLTSTTLHSQDEPKESCTIEVKKEHVQERPSYLDDETESSSCYSADSSCESENEQRAAVRQWQKSRSRVAWRWGWLQLQLQDLKHKMDECDKLLSTKRPLEENDHQLDANESSTKKQKQVHQPVKQIPAKHPFFSRKGLRNLMEHVDYQRVNSQELLTPVSSPSIGPNKKSSSRRGQKSLQINIPHSPYSLKSSSRTCQKSLRSRDFGSESTPTTPVTPKVVKDITTPDWRPVEDYDNLAGLTLVKMDPSTDDEMELEASSLMDNIPEDYFDIREVVDVTKVTECTDKCLSRSVSLNSLSSQDSMDTSFVDDDSSSEDTSDEAFAERHFCRELLERKRFYFPEQKKDTPNSPDMLPSEFFVTDEAFPLSNKKKPKNDPDELKEEKLKVKFLAIRSRYLGSPRFSRNWKRRKDLADWHSPTASQKALALSEILAGPTTCMVNPEDSCGEEDEVLHEDGHVTDDEGDNFILQEDSNDGEEEKHTRGRPRTKGRTPNGKGLGHHGNGGGKGRGMKKQASSVEEEKFTWELVKRELEPEKANRNIIILRRVPKFQSTE